MSIYEAVCWDRGIAPAWNECVDCGRITLGHRCDTCAETGDDQ